MMIKASSEPQTYQLGLHEFTNLSAKPKGGYSFSLQVANRKVVSGLKGSLVAEDLWQLLQTSPKANELMGTFSYQFSMDKDYLLRVEKLN